MPRANDGQVQGQTLDPFTQQTLLQSGQQANQQLVTAMQESGANKRAKTEATSRLVQTGMQGGMDIARQAMAQKAAAEAQDRELADKEKGRRADSELVMLSNTMAANRQRELEKSRQDYEDVVRTGDRKLFSELMDRIEKKQTRDRIMARWQSVADLTRTMRIFDMFDKGQTSQQKFLTAMVEAGKSAKYDQHVGEQTQVGTKAFIEPILPTAFKTGVGIRSSLDDVLNRNRIDGVDSNTIYGPDGLARVTKLVADGKLDTVKIGQLRRILDGTKDAIDSRLSALSGNESKKPLEQKGLSKANVADKTINSVGWPTRWGLKAVRAVKGYPEGWDEVKMQKTPEGREYDSLMRAKANITRFHSVLDSAGFEKGTLSGNPKTTIGQVVTEGTNRTYGTDIGGISKELMDNYGEDYTSIRAFMESQKRDPLTSLGVPLNWKEQVTDPTMQVLIEEQLMGLKPNMTQDSNQPQQTEGTPVEGSGLPSEEEGF